ncbi:universal stress protein [Maribacter polysiphoniae]|uniref:Nucleotide-binding universal stress UspA family protein n=1 Tax=Maribacter polysiphoniae TaxID=429344 RepID=A0A316E7T2_9FLAO|nr:universal stress protein [Maribacter polysiphoniae]MBD1260142.1 universal stress protein [Maribacter polysiphoniae]PWK25602.1 nucleotide-binding universal stress UspA family protein [Maribacter polysiphoniae]
MRNILVPIGTLPNVTETLQYAVDFAADFSAKIYVMDAFNISAKAGSLANISERLAKSGKERIKGVIDQVDSRNVDIKIATFNGELVDGIMKINKELGIDLIILSPKSNHVHEGLYLGNTSGKIIKRTDIPALIVPQGAKYIPFKSILTAFKSGVLKRKRILNPLITIQKKHDATVNLLLVKTPEYTDDDLKVNTALMDLCSNLTVTENATTYLGVMEHFQSKHPDLLCVFRRKRGFFVKLWEKNTISKSEFSVPIPVLILSVKKY